MHFELFIKIVRKWGSNAGTTHCCCSTPYNRSGGVLSVQRVNVRCSARVERKAAKAEGSRSGTCVKYLKYQ